MKAWLWRSVLSFKPWCPCLIKKKEKERQKEASCSALKLNLSFKSFWFEKRVPVFFILLCLCSYLCTVYLNLNIPQLSNLYTATFQRHLLINLLTYVIWQKSLQTPFQRYLVWRKVMTSWNPRNIKSCDWVNKGGRQLHKPSYIRDFGMLTYQTCLCLWGWLSLGWICIWGKKCY